MTAKTYTNWFDWEFDATDASYFITDKSQQVVVALPHEYSRESAGLYNKKTNEGWLAKGKTTKTRSTRIRNPIDDLYELKERYRIAEAKLNAIGPEPRKPSPEHRFFGRNGRAGADPKTVEYYDRLVKNHRNWRSKYLKLKKEEVAASNAWYHARMKNPTKKKRVTKKRILKCVPCSKKKITRKKNPKGYVIRVQNIITHINGWYVSGNKADTDERKAKIYPTLEKAISAKLKLQKSLKLHKGIVLETMHKR